MNKTKLPKIYRKSLLYKSGVEYADWSLNHVEGCSHGCNYPCYAMMLKKRCGVIGNYDEWIRPKIVANALDLLDREIPKYKKEIKFVHLCFTTDPFMYGHEEVARLTLKIIKKLNSSGIRCTVLTKGIYPKELSDVRKYSIKNEYGISLVSLDSNFKRTFEPFSAPFKSRIKSLYDLHRAGLKTWISMEPYPTPNLVRQDLREVLNEINFVDKIIFGKLNYNVRVSRFKRNKNFYYSCVNDVVDFCNVRGIKHHIKYGTKGRNNCKTKKIFKSAPNFEISV